MATCILTLNHHLAHRRLLYNMHSSVCVAQQAKRMKSSEPDSHDSSCIPTAASTSGKRLRGRRGRLQSLPSMPWDILFAVSLLLA